MSWKEKSHWNILNTSYKKKLTLRYGINPDQGSVLCVPENESSIFGNLKIAKQGKGGLSQANIEDIDQALRIIQSSMHSDGVIACVMKHANPSGVALSYETPSENLLCQIYQEARNTDPVAAFGSIVVIAGTPVTQKIAELIMEDFTDLVFAEYVTSEALEVFSDYTRYKKNKNISVIHLDRDLKFIFSQDLTHSKYFITRKLLDGSVMITEPDFVLPKEDSVICVTEKKPQKKELEEALFAWGVVSHVRSNAVVLSKNLSTLGIGCGEQDRVMALNQALYKAKNRYQGRETLNENILVASDGFVPFEDFIDTLHQSGISTLIQPGGSIRDKKIIQKCNEYHMCMLFTNKRRFSHH